LVIAENSSAETPCIGLSPPIEGESSDKVGVEGMFITKGILGSGPDSLGEKEGEENKRVITAALPNKKNTGKKEQLASRCSGETIFGHQVWQLTDRQMTTIPKSLLDPVLKIRRGFHRTE
jgi:hypothetical protein